MFKPQSYKVVQLGAGGEAVQTYEFAGGAPGSDDGGAQAKSWLRPDDTLGTVKRKITLAMGGPPPVVPSMYLFAGVMRRLDPEETFKDLTMNGAWPLTQARMEQFLVNVPDIDIGSIPVKDEYTYDDVLAMNLEDHAREVLVPLGLDFVTTERRYPFAVNPFSALELDPELVQHASALATTSNGRLLSDSGPLLENTIFMCLLKDVLRHGSGAGLAQQDLISIYYPILAQDGITNQETFDQGEAKFIQVARTNVGPAFERSVAGVDLFYGLGATGETLPYSPGQKGISSLKVLIAPAYTFSLPLDLVFRLSHASATVPFIKYVPLRGDPLYRLYTDGVSADGRRVPAMRKADIFRLAKSLARHRSVVAVSRPKKGIELTCEFRRDGAVELLAVSDRPLAESAMSAVLQEGSRTVIQPVRDYIAQRGYGLGEFSRLDDPNVSILSGTYTAVVRAPSKPVLHDIRGCTSSVFVGMAGGGMRYRFRRVANYDQMSPSNGVVADMLRRNEDMAAIQRALEEGFGMTGDSARKKIEEFLASQVRGERGIIDSRKIRLRVNPGFLTYLAWSPDSGQLSATLEGFDGTSYLETVPMYIDGLLRLALGEKAIPEAALPLYKQLCTGKWTAGVSPERDAVGAVEDLTGAFAGDAASADSDKMAEFLDIMGAEGDGTGASDDASDVSGVSDDEDSGVSEVDSLGSQVGGADTPEDRDPVGRYLSSGRGNWVLARLRERDPALFKVVKGSSGSYSRSCPWAVRRMPVILTDAEKEKIDREQPGSYTGAVRYGSPGGPRHWFICPRYWSLRKNMSVSPGGVDPDKIIPEKDASGKNIEYVPEGKDTVEFCSSQSPKEGRCTDDYKEKVPGFLKRGTAGTDMCLPCCFDRDKQTEKQKAYQRSCAKDIQDDGDEVGEAEDGEGGCEEEEPTNYIVDATRSGPTLRPGKFGALSPILQRFLGVHTESCYQAGYGSELKPGDTCLVRKGVEPSLKQSFVACIASAWIDERDRTSKPPCIKRMRAILRDALDLDRFVALQHGSLVATFGDPEADWPQRALYAESRLYKSVRGADTAALEGVKRATVAYARFREFLADQSVRMDQTYLWDLVCSPNDKLFPNGVNLVILEVPERDATNNVHVLCPTDHYTEPLYNPSRSTLLMVRHKAGAEAYYEPIYVYAQGRKRAGGTITRRLRLNRDLPDGLKHALERIASSIERGCGPLASVAIKAKTGPSLAKLVRLLEARRYRVTDQILNYSSQVVAVGAKSGDGEIGTVPCEPSPPIVDLPAKYTWIDELSPGLQRSYEETLAFLRKVALETNGAVPALPMVRVEESGVVVGVLTQTDQFVAVRPGPAAEDDGLEVMESSPPTEADKIAFSDEGPDTERLTFARNLGLEGAFFRAYRDTARILLGRPDNVGIRKQLQAIVAQRNTGYEERLDRALSLINRLTKDHVMFVEYSPAAMEALGDIPGCLGENACERQAACRETAANKCALAVPQGNLVNSLDNQETYPVRLADELVRYTRIQNFMFKPDQFLAFGEVPYNLGADEIILPAPLITQDYFDTLVAVERNRYATLPSFYTAQPQLSREYSSKLDVPSPATAAERAAPVAQGAPGCEGVLPAGRGELQGKWKKLFPVGSMDLIYPGSPAPCSFQLFLDLCAQEKKGVGFPELKESLAAEYRRLGDARKTAVLRAWRQQGKSALADAASESTLEDTVILDSYYATSLDYWMLAGLYDIPLVLYSGTKLKENGRAVLVAQAQKANRGYYFVKIPGKRSGSSGPYRLVARTEAQGGARIKVAQLEQVLQDMLEVDIGRYSVEEYLDSTGQATQAVGAEGAPGAQGTTRRIKRLRLRDGDSVGSGR